MHCDSAIYKLQSAQLCYQQFSPKSKFVNFEGLFNFCSLSALNSAFQPGFSYKSLAKISFANLTRLRSRPLKFEYYSWPGAREYFFPKLPFESQTMRSHLLTRNLHKETLTFQSFKTEE